MKYAVRIKNEKSTNIVEGDTLDNLVNNITEFQTKKDATKPSTLMPVMTGKNYVIGTNFKIWWLRDEQCAKLVK